METLLYLLARGLIGILQALPLRSVARFGRACGSLAFLVDARHRNVALANLAHCFGHERSKSELYELGRENFRRIGENLASAMKTPTMNWEELKQHVEIVGSPEVMALLRGERDANVVVAIGHFGNFELYARFGDFSPGLKCATTYRALRQPSLNRLMQDLRERSGCRYFERRFEAQALRQFMNEPRVVLGLLADQHAGESGIRLPFLGHDCSTSTAPAILALRYRCRLVTAICYRVGLAQWRIEAGEEIPTNQGVQTRPVADIMLDVNRALEVAVRRDPANWFWVHRRWKPAKRPRQARPAVGEAHAATPPAQST